MWFQKEDKKHGREVCLGGSDTHRPSETACKEMEQIF